MVKFSICKITHLPTGRYFLSMPASIESTRNAWRTKLKNGSPTLPFTVRALLNGAPAAPEDWSFEDLGEVTYDDYGAARDAFDALLLEHIEKVGWENLLNVDAYERTPDGRRIRTALSAQRRREANGTEEWAKF